jgi:hypothetical protein
MADEIVVKYDGEVKKLEDKLRSVEAEQIAIDKQAKKTGTTITKESEKAAASVQKVNKNVNGLKDSFNTLTSNLPFAGAIQQVTQLGNAFTGVTGTVGKTTGALNILKVAFASIGIGALVTAFGSLIAYFKSTEAGGDKLAKIMRVIGAVFGEVVKTVATLGGYLFDAGEAMYDFVQGTDIAAKSTDDYKKSVIELGAEIADLQDRIEELTITLDLQNDKLQTGIENNLRKLRSQNILLKESLEVIDKVGSLEEKKLSNSTKLIEEKLKLERKDFLLKTQNFGADQEKVVALQKVEHDLLNKDRSFREQIQLEIAQAELKKFDTIIAKNKEKGKIFDQFVKGEIDASQLLDRAQGTFQQEDAKRIADILKQREAAVRESGNLEERLNNFRDAAYNKDKARQDKIDADAKARQDKFFANALKRIDIEEKLAIGMAKIEGRSEGDIITIQEDFNAKKLQLFKDYGKGKTLEYQELILEQKTLEKGYTDFLDKEDGIRIQNEEKNNARKLKEEQEFNEKMKALDEGAGQELTDMFFSVADKEVEKIKEVEEEDKRSRERRKQFALQGLDLIGQAAQGIAEIQIAKTKIALDEEKKANDDKTANLIENLDQRKAAGLLNEAEYNKQKAKIQKDAAKKEAEIKKKQFQADQNAALTRIAIDTAVSVAKTAATAGYPAAIPLIALALAQGVIQAALVQAQPTPKFKDGVIDLQGKGTGTSDSIHAMLSKGESVMTAKETSEHHSLLQSIRDGKFEKYAYENIARPAIKRDQERRRKKELDSESLMRLIASNEVDTSHLERLTKKNNTIRMGNVDDIINGFERVLKKKGGRGI